MRSRVLRVGVGGLPGQGMRFAVVGSVATVLQLGLYSFLSGSTGAQLANICAWLVSTMVATAGHQRFTFGVRGDQSHGRRPADGPGRWRHGQRAVRSTDADQLVGLLTSLAGLGLSSVVLAALAQPDGLTGTIALVAVNTVVGALRFLALRWWLVGRTTPGPSSDTGSGKSAPKNRDVPDLVTLEQPAML